MIIGAARSSADLVPGDVYRLSKSAKNVPCDSLLLDGNCILDESMLTGESIPVRKTGVPQGVLAQSATRQDLLALKHHVVVGGTKLLRAAGSVGDKEPPLALALRTGFNTTKGSLLRSVTHPEARTDPHYRDAVRILAVFLVLGAVMSVAVVVNFYWRGVVKLLWLFRTLDIITTIVPPSLPAMVSIGTTYALHRLRKRKVTCIDPQRYKLPYGGFNGAGRINACGTINTFTFDKTGTLTESGLSIHGLIAVNTDMKL